MEEFVAQQMKWEELTRCACAGRQVLFVAYDKVYIGLIQDIMLKNKSEAVLDLAWCAKRDEYEDTWVSRPILHHVVCIEGRAPRQINNRQVHFLHDTGDAIIYPREVTILRTQDVIGLAPDWERLYETQHDLRLVRDIAHKALLYHGRTNLLDGMSERTTLYDILGMLPNDRVRVQFLMEYIKIFSGDNDVHCRVY